MAQQVALKVGKTLLNKKMSEKNAREVGPSGDSYKYYDYERMRHGKPTKRKKDIKYFEIVLGIPHEDAKVLNSVMNRARWIDGKKFGPVRIGVSTAIGFIPAVGDAIDGLLAMSLVKSAGGVSGGLDDGIRNKMVMNVVLEIVIGITPVLGDFADTFFQANTKNFMLLEKMLKKRVKENSVHTEKITQNPARSHARTDSYDTDHAQKVMSSGYDERHAGVHQRLQTQTKGRTVEKPQKSRTGWLGRRDSREQDRRDDAQPMHDSRSQRGGRDEDAAPARPPRPGTAGQHRTGDYA